MSTNLRVGYTETPATRKVRVGIVGTGFISDFHIRSLRALPFVELVGVCDVDRLKAQAAARQHNISAAFSDTEEMIRALRPDAVHVLVPPVHHARVAIECMEAGADVLIEKPLAVSSEECRLIAAVAHRTGRYAGVNHNAVYQPAVRRLAAEIQACRIGAVQHVSACVNVPLRQLAAGQHGDWMFQEPGNIILEQAPHPLSQIQFLLGDITTAAAVATGEITLKTGKLFYDTWQLSLTCERGTAQSYLAFEKGFFDCWIHVIGEDGAAFLDLRRNTLRVIDKTRFMEPIDQLMMNWRGARQTSAQSLRNLFDYVFGFLKVKPVRDSFVDSLAGSIRGWHESRLARVPAPGSVSAATNVITTCESCIRAVSIGRSNYVHA